MWRVSQQEFNDRNRIIIIGYRAKRVRGYSILIK